MDHSEAVQQMAAERYLLDELSPELRDAFEEHLFDCSECTLDVRAEAAFLDEAKRQLPGLTAFATATPAAQTARPVVEKRDWLGWLRPMFSNPMIAGPVFAALLVVVGYQNLVTYPELRSASAEPHQAPLTSLHAGTRASARAIVKADRKQGVSLAVDLPDLTGYSSYTLSLIDAQGKQVWISAPSAAPGAEGSSTSLGIPGRMLQQGAYTLAVSGIGPNGQSTEIQRNSFEIHFKD